MHDTIMPGIFWPLTYFTISLWQIGLPFAYDAMFAPGVPLELSNIAYERMCLLLNLASLYCHLATDEDRSTMEEIKRAVTSFVVSAKN